MNLDMGSADIDRYFDYAGRRYLSAFALEMSVLSVRLPTPDRI
jgi:hypothetical protein